MEAQTLFNTPHVIPLGKEIATYFYLTGISAGSFVISVIAVLGGRTEYKALAKIGSIMAPLALVIAPLFLVIDLEQPTRFWYLFVYLHMTSPITYGTFLLTSYPLNATLYAWALFTGRQKAAKLIGIIGIPLAVCVHGYTGFILALGKGRPLWSTALMPTLFLVSAMVSGFALMVVAASIYNRWAAKKRDPKETEVEKGLILNLVKFLGAVIIVDLFLISNDILVLLTSKAEEYYVAQLLLHGKFTFLFLGVEVFLGSLIPLILIFVKPFRGSLASANVASVLVLLGIYAMRLTVVYAGQSIPLH
ncbi:MAG: polysulfide reductase NrfD [Nitrospirae bacterium]|nr:polysulfide reductase NrfD [Nitrospirota bacterium]